MEDENVLNTIDSIKAEAVKNAIGAFNEGFLLGKQYAEQLFKNESKK